MLARSPPGHNPRLHLLPRRPKIAAAVRRHDPRLPCLPETQADALEIPPLLAASRETPPHLSASREIQIERAWSGRARHRRPFVTVEPAFPLPRRRTGLLLHSRKLRRVQGVLDCERGSIARHFSASACSTAVKEDIRMDEVTQAVENLKNDWSQAVTQLEVCIAAIESCGQMGKGTEEANSLPRLNGSAQDALQVLNALQCRLNLLAEQLPSFEEVQSGQATLASWKEQYQKLRASLRSANLQAKANIKKAAEEERKLLLGGGEESTIRRRNLQTKAGMTSAAESTTESLRRSRQMMVQEVERSANTLSTFDESTSVLRKAEGEYQGHRSLLMRTRGLLSTMQRQDVLDRIILTIGFLIFSLAVLYVVSRRIGLLTLQRKLADAIRSGSISAEDIVPKVHHGPAPTNIPTAPPVYDEL